MTPVRLAMDRIDSASETSATTISTILASESVQ